MLPHVGLRGSEQEKSKELRRNIIPQDKIQTSLDKVQMPYNFVEDLQRRNLLEVMDLNY